MATAGTYRKQPCFGSPARLEHLCDTLLELAEKYGWRLQAWAVLANHYHFVGLSPSEAASLQPFIRHLHSVTGKEINRRDCAPGRRVWFEYWETRLTYQKSYLARLSYVHRNAVHHGLVRVPSAYHWCSAGWFERRADSAFYHTVMNFPCDRLRLPDDYVVDASELVAPQP